MPSAAPENLLSTFDYLLHLERLRRKPIYRLADHKLPFYHEYLFLELPGIESDLVEGNHEVWLRIRRLQAHSPPEPPETLHAWLNLPGDPKTHPTLAESISIEVTNDEDDESVAPDQVELRLEDQPEIHEAFERYIEDKWLAWSEEEKPRRVTISHYDRFFSLQQEAESGAAEDAIEIVWGVGMVQWDGVGGTTDIAYSLITKTVEIQIDEISMSLNFIPTEREQTVNIDSYIALGLPGEEVEVRAKKEFDTAESTFSPFDTSTFEGVLRFAASHLDSHGIYWPDINPNKDDRTLPASTTQLVITDTWTIFARNRGTNFIAADIQRLRDAVAAGAVIEGAPALIVTEPPNTVVDRGRRRYRGISSPGMGSGGDGGSKGDPDEEIEDLFFPKPFNDEQVQIVERAEQAEGVVVQGPPGTGKTHTIANIICHYLAKGKKVLVTSQHEAPLAVLQEQIPEPLRPLTISLLTSERDGLRQLEQSVRQIAGEIGQINIRELELQIKAETDRIDQLHQKLAVLDRELRRWGEKQTSEVPFLGDSTRPAVLAQKIIEQEAEFAWFPDRLEGESPPSPSFNDDDIDELRAARLSLGTDLQYLSQNIPASDQLLLPEDMVRLHEELCRFYELEQAVTESSNIPPLKGYKTETLTRAETLRNQAEKILAVLKATESAWHASARKLLKPQDTEDTFPLSEHLQSWIRSALEIDKQRQEYLGDAIEMPEAAETHGELYSAVERAASDRRPFAWFGGDKEAKLLFEQIRMQSASPNSTEQWQRIKSFLDFARTTNALITQWNQISTEFDGPTLEKSTAIRAARQLAKMARPLKGLWVLEAKLSAQFITEAKGTFAGGFKFDQLTHDIEELEHLIMALTTHLKYSGLKTAINEVRSIRETIYGCTGPIIDEIISVVDEGIGKEETTAEQLMEAWSAILNELRRLERLTGELNTIENVTQAIETSGAPLWAQRLRKDIVENDSDPWTPKEWRNAWEWARARGYLEAIDGHKALQKLTHERKYAEAELNKAYLHVIECRTWRQLKQNMTGLISSALQAYLTAITRIGLGTGVRAKRYRVDAQKAMKTAYGAVPCWIMPHWRVSESLPAIFGLFDLVIIDEASQSDAWAIPAIARAKKLLVVGDDKQVSPSDVGMAEADIRSLRERFLSKLTYGQHLLPGSSIYDLASTMFATDVIRLREHFRCVEPIISFSNHTFYRDEIRPLRVPKPSERLDPPLIDVFVKGGYRQDRKKINKPEARFITEEIKQITQNPNMVDRTIGVISLLGHDQAKYIQEKLLKDIGESTIIRHNIRCGDAMHFQGKEADIIFISMVAAGSIRADSGRSYEQRYNVACSRPRDRLYVVHSFTRNEVRDNDLRAKLLDHLANPLGTTAKDVNDNRELCESDFEREVYDELVRYNYRVTPQVNAGGYRIDMVVEGNDDRRLAVECDGDQYHGVDRWMHDIGRQRTLERMGWRFWRCWGSSWTFERQACIDDLKSTLEERGISPIGSEVTEKNSLVEYRVIELQDDTTTVSSTVSASVTETLISNTDVIQDMFDIREPEPEYDKTSPKNTTPLKAHKVVEIGDRVVYMDIDQSDKEAAVLITSGQSDGALGVVNHKTPLADALLGAEAGDEVEAFLPLGTKRLRIVDIYSD